MKNIEQRVFRVPFQIKRSDGAPTQIIGHAAVFDQPTDLGWFIEEIAPGFFKNALKTSDVRSLFNHDPNFVLGRNRSGTLRLKEDTIGLYTETDVSDSQLVRDLVLTPLERGDIDGMSFAFTTKTDQWTKDKNGDMIRRLIEAEEIFDISVVTYPAYPQTDVTVASRSLELWKAPKESVVAIADDNQVLAAKAAADYRKRHETLKQRRSLTII